MSRLFYEHQLITFLKKRSSQERFYFSCIAWGTLFLGWFLFLYLPTEQIITQHKKAIYILKQDYDRLLLRSKIYAQKKASYNERAQELTTLIQNLHPSAESLELLMALATRHSLSTVCIEPSPPHQDIYAAYEPYKIKFEGAFHRICSFLEQIPTLEALIITNTIQLERYYDTNLLFSLDLTFVTSIYTPVNSLEHS